MFLFCHQRLNVPLNGREAEDVQNTSWGGHHGSHVHSKFLMTSKCMTHLAFSCNYNYASLFALGVGTVWLPETSRTLLFSSFMSQLDCMLGQHSLLGIVCLYVFALLCIRIRGRQMHSCRFYMEVGKLLIKSWHFLLA